MLQFWYLQFFSNIFIPRGVPNNQMPRGREADYKPLYIIRAVFSGETIPGKYNGDWGQAYIPFGGIEHSVSNFEVKN